MNATEHDIRSFDLSRFDLTRYGLSTAEAVQCIRNESAIKEYFCDLKMSRAWGGDLASYLRTVRRDKGMSVELDPDLVSACQKIDQKLEAWFSMI